MAKAPAQEWVRTAGNAATVGALFRARAGVGNSSTAVEYRDRRISYRELLDRVDRAGAMLALHGLTRGDRLVLLSRNSRSTSRSSCRVRTSAL